MWHLFVLKNWWKRSWHLCLGFNSCELGQKIVQNGSVVLRRWAITRRGLAFLGHACCMPYLTSCKWRHPRLEVSQQTSHCRLMFLCNGVTRSAAARGVRCKRATAQHYCTPHQCGIMASLAWRQRISHRSSSSSSILLAFLVAAGQ